MLKKC